MRRFLTSMIFAAPLLSGAVAGELTLTLEEAIAIARLKSVDAAVALDELKTAYWEWRTFRADQLPEVSFSATAPSYANQYSSYMNGDGDYSFVKDNHLTAEIGILSAPPGLGRKHLPFNQQPSYGQRTARGHAECETDRR